MTCPKSNKILISLALKVKYDVNERGIRVVVDGKRKRLKASWRSFTRSTKLQLSDRYWLSTQSRIILFLKKSDESFADVWHSNHLRMRQYKYCGGYLPWRSIQHQSGIVLLEHIDPKCPSLLSSAVNPRIFFAEMVAFLVSVHGLILILLKNHSACLIEAIYSRNRRESLRSSAQILVFLFLPYILKI